MISRIALHALAGCLVLLACTPDSKQADSAVGVTEAQRAAVEDTIRKIVDYSIAAQNKGDMNAIKPLFAPTALSVQSGVIKRDINAMFAEYDSGVKLAGGNLPQHKVNVERIDVLSPDAAVVTTTSQGSIRFEGKEHRWGHVYTGVWQNRDGKWQVIVEHASPVPDDSATVQ